MQLQCCQQRNGKTEDMKEIIVFISIFLLSCCENLVLPLAWTFPLYSFIWMRVVPTVYFLPLPCEMPVAPRLSPEVKMDYCRRTACPALLHISHTPLLHYQPYPWGKCCACAHTLTRSLTHSLTHKDTHTHIRTQTHRSESSDRVVSKRSETRIWQIFFFFFGETKTFHIQLNW